MSDEQARRVGLNEALFRDVNEQINRLNRTFGPVETMSVVCECADGECTERIDVPLPTDERIRADERCFVIAVGHEVPDFESVVERTDEWEIVRKHPGTPARLARRTDPRA